MDWGLDGKTGGEGGGVDAGIDYAGCRCDSSEGLRKDGAGEEGVDEDGVGFGGAVPFEKVKGEAVQVGERVVAWGEELVREVAVEEDFCGGIEEAQKRDGRGELVDEDDVWGREARV